MRFCFVSTTRGSYFMTELLGALAWATAATGHEVELVLDAFPPLAEDLVYVVVPHEFEAWASPAGAPGAAQRARTIALCTENPGTEWFEATYRLVASFGAAVSINRSSAAELRRRGVRCEHVQLGYCASWDSWRGDERAERELDVLYLGAADPRRDPLLAGIGARLWARNCQFLVPPLEPRTAPRADFLKEEAKYRRLASSKILLNLHRTTSAALEWMRFLEAICNGCVVVSEPSLDGDPLLAGEHFVEAPVEQIAAVAAELLDDPERLRALRERAYRFVREQLPIEPAGRRLVELASELPRSAPPSTATAEAAQPSATPLPAAEPSSSHLDLSDLIAPAHDAGELARATAVRGPGQPLRTIARRLLTPARRGVLAETPSYRAAERRVSALVAIASAGLRDALELLDILARSNYGDLEIVLLALDGDASAERAAARFLTSHPEIPIAILHARVSGLGEARNLLTQRARGEHVLVLPLAGGVFPATVERLAQALDAEPRASFCYPMIAVVQAGQAVALRGSMPWEPGRLTRENWIDTPALIKRERLLALGGYATDARLCGLEDFDLWCRFADASELGVHVPQVLGWRAGEDAQPNAIASLAAPAVQLLRERSPRLFAESAET
jgi:hypothetical protein